MNGVNFIPAHRREIGARRARLRAWTVGIVAYAILAILGFALCGALAAGEDQVVARKLEQLPPEIDSTRQTLNGLRGQLSEVQARLDAAITIIHQPDWAVLLGLLAQSLGDEIVLTSCRLQATPAGDPPRGNARSPIAAAANASPQAPASERFTLTLSGIGQSHSAVSQFILRLERIGLFERVTLIKTSRQMFRDQEAIGFQAEAVLGGAGVSSVTVDAAGGVIR